MLSITKDKKVNSKISQLKLVLKKHLVDNKNNIECIFKKLGNLNDQVQTTKYLESQHPEWIGYTALHFAAQFEIHNAYKILIDKGIDFTLENNDGATALHVAIETHSSEMIIPDFFVGLILSAHLNTNNFRNPSNKNGLSHFHVACSADEDDLVEQFLNHGVSVDDAVNMDSTSCPGYTGLHFSAEYRRFDVTKVLLSHGANTQIKDARGMTPLHLALKNYLETVDPVIAEKYNPNIFIKVAQDREISEMAMNQGFASQGTRQMLAAILRLFFIHHSNGNMIIDEYGLSQLHLLCTLSGFLKTEDRSRIDSLLAKPVDINQSVNVNSPVWPGYTVLHFAAHVDVEMVNILLKSGANIEAKNAEEVTPFDICLRKCKVSDIHNIILLKPNWKSIVLFNGKTRLSDVIFAMRDADCFKKFLRRLAKNLHVHVPNDSPLWPGFSLMHLAVILSKRQFLNSEESMREIVLKLFDRAPALLHHQEAHGWTPLHLAYRLQKDQVISLLIKCHQNSANPADVADEDGLTFAHIASTTNKEDFLEKLLSNGSNVNAVYRGTSFTWRGVYPGSNPLHFAIARNSGKAMQTLLKYHADVYAKDENDMTPVHLLVTTKLTDYGHGHLLLNLPDLKDSLVSGVGLSHLHVACLRGYYVSTENLVKNGANINQTLTSEPIKNEALKCLKDWQGCTPVKIALKNGFQECIDVFAKLVPGFPCNDYQSTLDILVDSSNVYVNPSRLYANEELLARLQADFGITGLHLACWDWPQYHGASFAGTVNSAADVDARIHADSPVWPGWTPVHVLLSTVEDFFWEEAFDALIGAGINVLLSNVDGETPVHIGYRYLCGKCGNKLYSLLNKLLEAQKDFSVNPTGVEGISHFHIACAMSNASVVEKFLNCGSIDVNQPIDFFHETAGGQTPLHLIASGRNYYTKASMQLQTAELLLKNGANVHVENSCGNTALHECFRLYWKSIELFERIAKEGADVNARNILGHTPLKYFLSEEKIEVEDINTLLKLGCHFNAFNSLTEEGCLGQNLYSISLNKIERLLITLKTHFSSSIETDNRNRTILHNMASSVTETKIPADKFAAWVNNLSRIGCDIDDQDEKGRTPLHMAVDTQNVHAVRALLLAGADVDIVDDNDATAFYHCSRGCDQCEDVLDDSDADLDYCEFVDEDDKNNDVTPCCHIEMFKTMAIHVRKLLHCGLDVREDNRYCSEQACMKSADVNELSERFLKELKKIKKFMIEPCSFRLSDLLFETGAVIDFPTMPLVKRTSISEFFSSSSKMHSFRKDFKETAGIIQLQYRKAVMRSDLVESARDSLSILSGVRLDDLCFYVISKFLKNSELKSLIASTNRKKSTQT